MDMLRSAEIAAAGLRDWRKLAQGLHARYLVPDFTTAARFVTAIADAGGPTGHHPRVVIGDGHVDLKLVSRDAVFRDSEGNEHVVEWVTQRDVDLARAITDLAAERGLVAAPTAVSEVELGLDTGQESVIAPVWAALLTGDAASQGRGTPGDEIRDATERVPHLWFGDGTGAQRVHIEVYVPPECVAERTAAVTAAGGTVLDDAESPGLTVFADQDGNRGVLCADVDAAAAAEAAADA